MRYIGLLLLFTSVSYLSCKDKGASLRKNEEITATQDSLTKPALDSIVKFARDRIVKLARDSIAKLARDSIAKLAHDSAVQANLKVTAFLVFKDGSSSTFDVLNDKNIILWNTIIGAGDAEKPSTSTKICLDGGLDSLNIRIKNGRKLVIDTATIHSEKHLEFVIGKTGCQFVAINVTRAKRHVYTDTIYYRCGE